MLSFRYWKTSPSSISQNTKNSLQERAMSKYTNFYQSKHQKQLTGKSSVKAWGLHAIIFNDTLGKTCALLNSVQKFTKIQGWLLLTFFICLHIVTRNCDYGLHNQLSSFYSIIVQMSEKHDSSNTQSKLMVASFSNFYGKIWVGFCFNIRKCFFL